MAQVAIKKRKFAFGEPATLQDTHAGDPSEEGRVRADLAFLFVAFVRRFSRFRWGIFNKSTDSTVFDNFALGSFVGAHLHSPHTLLSTQPHPGRPMKKLLPLAALALAAAAAFTCAVAAPKPATATFQVQIKINKACSVAAGAASNIDFGTQDASATALAANRAIAPRWLVDAGIT